MENNIIMRGGGLKCDSCDFRDDSIKVKDYPKWINAPCPRCGANLLTEADFKAVKRLIALGKLFGFFFSCKSERRPEGVTIARAEFDGSGKPKFTINTKDGGSL